MDFLARLWLSFSGVETLFCFFPNVCSMAAQAQRLLEVVGPKRVNSS
jgi:hypothetical protein